jgi:aryl-alcohol dehydrogenase-like predicted oxidoreductase
VLTGKYNKAADADGRARQREQVTPRSLGIAAHVITVAQELDATPSQVAIAWARQGEGNIIPLVGARTVAQLDDNLGCLDVTLSDTQMARLNEASAIEPGFPHDMLRPQSQATARRLHNHRAATTPEYR